MGPLASAASAVFLLVTPLNQSFLAPSSCLSSSFYGNYRSSLDTYQSVFLPDEQCLKSFSANEFATEAHIAPIARPEVGSGSRLVWLEKEVADVDVMNREKESMDNFFHLRFGNVGTLPLASGNQKTFSQTPFDAYEAIYQVPDALLLSVPRDHAHGIDLLLPRFWKATPLPLSPVDYIPILPEDVEPVRKVLSELRFSPDIAAIVNSINITQMEEDIRYLTGEDGKSGIVSRHSFTPGAIQAAEWIKKTIEEESGAECELWKFMDGFTPDVICRYKSTVPSDTKVIISAHYDSRGSFGSMRAPGGDDDGSGTTAILAIARTIGKHGLRFHTNVELVAFGGEEQGLLGSKAYALKLRNQKEKVALVVQADMLAYRAPFEPLQLGLPETIGTPEATQLVANISAIYSPELTVGYTKVCCSDHQSFHDLGYPATQLFERAGAIADPMYHNSGDLSEREGFSFEQLYAIAKVQFATLLHTAGFEVPRGQ